MELVDINDVNTGIAIISGILSILSVVVSILKIKLESKKNVKNFIQKALNDKEKELIDQYFQNLDYEDIAYIRKNNLEIENEIRQKMENHLENSSQNIFLSILDNGLSEIMRENRYRLLSLILSKINKKSTSKRYFRLTLILLSNYAFYLSKFLLHLLAYLLIIYIFALPFYFIILNLYNFYNLLELQIFMMVILILSILLYTFGKKE